MYKRATWASIKQFWITKAIDLFLRIIAKVSSRNTRRILGFLKPRLSGQVVKEILNTIDKQWDVNGTLSQFLRRIPLQINQHCRERFIRNFVSSIGWGIVRERREEFKNITGFYPPLSYLISPTMRCNLQCPDCYAGEYKVKDEMSISLIDRILSEGKDSGCYFVTFLGGEPFVRRDIWEVFRQHPDITFQVFTNGTQLDNVAITKLAKLGNIIPIISLEGFEDETDARRGKGTYRKIMSVMDCLHNAGVIFGFSCMITRSNWKTIISDEFNNLLLNKGAFLGWHFLYMPVGRNPNIELMPTPEERNMLRMNGAQRIRRRIPLLLFDFWNDAPYVGGCIAGGKSYFHINANGDVEPCVFAHFAVDNIKDKSFRDVLSSPFFESVRSRQPFSENLLMPCMLIDHPSDFQEIYLKHQPYPTHKGADRIINELAQELVSYSEGVARIMNQVWQDEYANLGFGKYEDAPLRVIVNPKQDV